MQGWIKLHRKVREHPFFMEKRQFSRFEAWLDLLMRANHHDNKFLLGNEIIEVERGSFITSEVKLMKAWGWSKTKVRSFLSLLEAEQMIKKESDQKKTTISICNYSVYQDLETTEKPLKDQEETAKRLQKDTNKNDKNVKNEKNDNKTLRRKRVYDEESVHYQLANLLFEKILENNPAHKMPDLQKWADDVRLMMERDSRTEEQIQYLIEWSQSHSFWHKNILSTSKLREQFDRLVMEVKSQKVVHLNKKQEKRVPRAYQSLMEWAEEGEHEQERDSRVVVDSHG